MKTQIIIMWVASLVLTGAFDVIASTHADSAKVADIRRLTEITRHTDLYWQMMTQIKNEDLQGPQEVPEQFWNDFLNALDPNNFVDQVVIPIYDKHFTHEEIKQLIEFFESDIGKMILREENRVFMKHSQEITNSEQSGDINTLDDLIKIIEPSLNKHLAPEEIKQLIEFFESEAGKKLIEKTPIIAMEASQGYEKFIEKLIEETIKKHREEGNQ